MYKSYNGRVTAVLMCTLSQLIFISCCVQQVYSVISSMTSSVV